MTYGIGGAQKATCHPLKQQSHPAALDYKGRYSWAFVCLTACACRHGQQGKQTILSLCGLQT